MDDGQLFIETGFDISGVDEAIDKISQKLKSGQKELDELKNIQVEINKYMSVLEEKLSDISRLIDDGTDGVKEGNSLLEVQVEHANTLGEKYARLNDLLDQTTGKIEQIENTQSTVEVSTGDTGTAEQISEIATNARTATEEVSQLNAQLNETSAANIEMPDFSAAQSEAERLTAEIEKEQQEAERINAELEEQRRKLQELTDEANALVDATSHGKMGFDIANSELFKKQYLEPIQEATKAVEQLEGQLQGATSRIAELQSQYNNVVNNPIDIEVSGAEEARDNILDLGDAAEEARDSIEEISGAEEDVANHSANIRESANRMIEPFQKFRDTMSSSVVESFERAKDRITSGVSKIATSFEKVLTRIKNMIFRFVVMRTLYAAFDALKNIMSAVNQQNNELSNSFNTLKSNLLVAFYPVIELLSKALQSLVNWLIEATQWVAAFIHAITGKDIDTSVKKAKELFDAMNAEENAKKEKAAINAKIKAKQNEIKELEKQAKAIKKEYEEEKKAIDKKKEALDDEIDAVNKTIKALRRQEDAEKKVAQALKKSIEEQIDALKKKKSARKSELDAEKKAVNEQIKLIEDQIKALRKQKEAKEESAEQDKGTLAGFDTLQVLSTNEEKKDTEVQALDDQIEALEEKKEALEDVKDAIPSDSEDPLIQQIEEEIEALEKQKNAIEEVDYTPLIQQQEDIIEKYRDQKEALNDVSDKLKDEYDFKINGIDESKQSIQDVITQLQNAKADIGNISRNTVFSPKVDTGDMNEKLKTTEEKINVFKKAWDKLKEKLSKFYEETGLSKTFKKISDSFATFKESMHDLFTVLGKLFEKIWNSPFVKWIRSSFVEWFSLLKKQIGIFAEFFAEKVRFVLDIGSLIAKSITAFIEGDFKGALKMIIKIGARFLNHIISVTETVIKLLLNGLAGLLSPITEAIGFLSDKIGWDWDTKWFNPDNWTNWHWEGINIDELPALARGAVLPGGQPFLAMVNDQPKGQTNIEAPLDTIKQALAEVIAQWNPQFNITADASSSEFVRLLRIKIEEDEKRSSAFA